MIKKWLIILQVISLSYGSDNWPNHDISTLKLLQIVHRHGDRTPLEFAPNDPYRDKSLWKEGIGQLTKRGKYRMYKLGKFIRDEYDSYLGQNYSPREVYARSSITPRCLESASCLLSGAYPPKPEEWQWSNGSDPELGRLWQPFAIETFMPKHEDLVLKEEKHCPIIDRERRKSYNSDEVKKFLEDNNELFKNLSKIVGHKVDSLKKARRLHMTLQIEMDRGLYWNDIWTKEEQEDIVKKLLEVHRMTYRIDWNRPIIKRLRAGGLIKELIKNFRSAIKRKTDKKLYVYSTHDSMIGALMNALNIFNNNVPPFGAALLFELHQNSSVSNNEYFVRIFYHNQTLGGIPHAMSLSQCDNSYECLYDKFIDSTKHLIYYNFNEECNDFDGYNKNFIVKSLPFNTTD